MKVKKYYYMDRDGNYRTRTVRVKRRHSAIAWLSALLALAFVALVGFIGYTALKDVDLSGLLSGDEPAPTVTAAADAPAPTEVPVTHVPMEVVRDEATLPPEDGDAIALDAPTAAPAPTAGPQAEAMPAPRDELDEGAAAASGSEALDGEGLLPVVDRADTDRRVVAIVVERCDSAVNVQTILRLALKYDGFVTLCPTGRNVAEGKLNDALTLAAGELNDEIAATAWADERLYTLPDGEMADAVWRSGNAVETLLGSDMRPLFYRMAEGRGERDQRTHNYLDQLGYRAVIRSAAPAGAGLEAVKAAVAPGAILILDDGDDNLELLRALMPWLSDEGYTMVTLRQLFDVESLDVYDPTVPTGSAPSPRAYVPAYATLSEGDCAWAVAQLQQRLAALGRLDEAEISGEYGAETARAVAEWQAEQGLPATGAADRETQIRLLNAQD